MSERSDFQLPDALADDYELIEELGRGGQGVAYLAEERASGERVVVKWLSVPRVDDWKTIELFEREATVLENLDHRHIPAYITDCVVGGPDDDAAEPTFYLVQSYAPGQPLDRLLEEEEGPWQTEQIEDFLAQMFDILDYLQQHNPPVVHRDIKPSNIIRSPQGTYSLVDFGSVQEALSPRDGGSTFVGTSGFMPPEQMQGRAVPASDQYALAATAIQLASGTPPAQMDSTGMQLDFRPHCDLPDALAAVLERMLAPRPTDRFDGAAEALEALESGAAPTSASSVALARRDFPDREEEPPSNLNDDISAAGLGGSALTEAWRRSKADNETFGFYELTVIVALLLLLLTFPLMLADLVGTFAANISVVVIMSVGFLYFKFRFNRWNHRY